MTTCTIRDDFAGPGGWEQGLRTLGYHGPVIGVEHDRAACDTAEAAGFARIHGDVRDPGLPLPTKLYIASPPCPTFSPAGKGHGRRNVALLQAALQVVTTGLSPTAALAASALVANVTLDDFDDRSTLVLHPMHVIQQAMPEAIALEQVPAVLPIWEEYATSLETMGYQARTGLLNAKDFGVPQSRKRAVLVAVRRDAAARRGLSGDLWPEATHNEPVSMASALGWGMTHRPSMTVTGGGSKTGGSEPFGNAARQGMRREFNAGRWEGELRTRPGAMECGVLQSFPWLYPWRGNKGQQFQQAGDAIPPLLAAAILRPLLPLTHPVSAAKHTQVAA